MGLSGRLAFSGWRGRMVSTTTTMETPNGRRRPPIYLRSRTGGRKAAAAWRRVVGGDHPLPGRALHDAQGLRKARRGALGERVVHEPVHRRPGRVVALVNVAVFGIAPAAIGVLYR